MYNDYRTSWKPTCIITAIYAVWSLGVQTPLGPGGLVIVTPVVAVVVFAAHNMLRWMIK